MTGTIEITLLQEHDFRRAAEIYCEAFERKIRLIRPSKERGISLFEKIINWNNAICAMENEECVGIAGLQHGNESFITPTPRAFIQTVGLLRGLLGYVAFRMMGQTITDGELRIESLAVLSSCRGKGIGSLLLAEVNKNAQKEGYKTISLEVVDTNQDARRLYERNGYSEEKTTHYPFLKHLAGFSAVTLMKKQLLLV